MKKILFFCLCLVASTLTLRAQYSKEMVTSTTLYSYLVGILPPDNAGNYAKLQIDILGGAWGANNLGITTYYVVNRGGLVIDQTTMGSGSSAFTIKAYANPNGNTDTYIIETSAFPSFAIKSCMLQGNATQLQTIVQQTSVGNDVTPAVSTVLITDQNGNIGIGTANTNGYKFAVEGNMHAQQVTVDLYFPAGDYVFESTYKLPDLTTLKTYLDKNHHLPEVPTAGDMAKNGMNLGDMNELLLKRLKS